MPASLELVDTTYSPFHMVQIGSLPELSRPNAIEYKVIFCSEDYPLQKPLDPLLSLTALADIAEQVEIQLLAPVIFKSPLEQNVFVGSAAKD